jgi:hypothetical protein
VLFATRETPETAAVPMPMPLSDSSQSKLLLPVCVLVPFQYATCPLVPLPPTFPLNVLQSELLNAPLFVADAVGKLNVCVDVELAILKSVPVVPVAKVWVEAVRPFRDVMPPPPPPVELIVYTPAASLTVTLVPAVMPTTGSVTVLAG